MKREVLEQLSDALHVFKDNKCTGCNTCESTNEICLEVIKLRSKINKRIKEIEDGR